MTILIVDDYPTFHDIFKEYLKKHEVLTASNGLEAYNILQKHDVDVIVLDLDMPIMSGWELMGKLVGQGYPTKEKVIIFSAEEETGDFVIENSKCYFNKNVSMSLIVEAIEQMGR